MTAMPAAKAADITASLARITIAPLLLAWLCLCLAGCGFPPPQSEAERDARQSCTADVNRVYDAQHRDQMSERPETDAPFSGSTPPPLPSDGLSDRFAYESDVSNCLNRSVAVPVRGAAD